MTSREQTPRRVLVAYDSKFGSTAEIATEIGRALAGMVDSVAVLHVDAVESVDGFDLVVVGSPIRFENWMPGVSDFVRAHRDALANRRVAFFFTCMALSRPGPASQRSADGYETKIRAIAPEILPLDVGRFAGMVDYSRMSLVGRVVFGTLLTVRGARSGDYRNWKRVRSWAESLAASDTRVAGSP